MPKFRRGKSRSERLKQIAISLPVAVLVSAAYVNGRRYFELRHSSRQFVKALLHNGSHTSQEVPYKGEDRREFITSRKSSSSTEKSLRNDDTDDFSIRPHRDVVSRSTSTSGRSSSTSFLSNRESNFGVEQRKLSSSSGNDNNNNRIAIEIDDFSHVPNDNSDKFSKRRRLESQDDDNSFPDDIFSDKQLRYGAFLFHCVGMLYTFFALAIVCDEFFVPSLEVIVARLRIPEDVAGATFMAAGGSAPELWTSFIGLFVSKDEVGFGTIVGSAVFNILFVIGSCAFASSTLLTLTWWPLTRDVFFYAVSLIMLTYFFYDDKIYLYEGIAMFVLYCLYVVFMCYNEAAQIRVGAFIHRIQGKFRKIEDESLNNNSNHGHGDHNDNNSNNEDLQIIDSVKPASKKGAKSRGEGKIVPLDSDIEAPELLPRSKSMGWHKIAHDNNNDGQQAKNNNNKDNNNNNDDDDDDSEAKNLSKAVERTASFERMSMPPNFKLEKIGRERGISDPSDTTSYKGDDRYSLNDPAVSKAKKPRPTDAFGNLEGDSRRTSTGMMRRLHVTRGAGEHNPDPNIPPGARRGRRMSETSRMMFGLEGPSKGYKALFHEGGTIAARQMFQVSVMKTMIPRSQTPGEKFLKTVKAAATIAKHERDSKIHIEYLNKQGGAEYGQEDMGGVEPISVKPKNDLHSDGCGDPKIVSLEDLHNVDAKNHSNNDMMKVEDMDGFSKTELISTDGENGKGAGKHDKDNDNDDNNDDDNNDEEHENDALDLTFPDEPLARVIYLMTAPITFSLYYTVPDVRRSDRENFFVVSFIMSIMWIVVYTFCMVWWATVIGDTLNIPSVIMGLTILAAGTSVPDLLTSVIVATHGHGDMAVSSSIGSNLFDVCIGLPIPWIIYIIVYNKPVEVGTNLILISVAILFIMLVATISTIAMNKWQMTKTMGVMMFLLYLLFMVVMIIIDAYAD